IRTHPRRSVPGELRQRLRQFLQPAVVGEAAVVNMRIATDGELISLDRLGRCSKIMLRLHRLRRELRSSNETIVNGAAPEGLEIGAVELCLPESAHQVVAGNVRLTIQNGQYLVRAVSAVKWRNQRLYDRHGAIRGAGITPLLKVMRSRDHP